MDSETQAQYTIRLAALSDVGSIGIAYGKMLNWLDGQDFAILPTFSNVEWMTLHIFEPAITDGRSEILIVEDLEGGIASILFWVVDAEVLETRHKTATAYGQWVEPEYRGNKLVPKMVYEAKEDLRRRGIQRVMDMVHIDSAREAAEACGFRVNNNIVTLEI